MQNKDVAFPVNMPDGNPVNNKGVINYECSEMCRKMVSRMIERDKAYQDEIIPLVAEMYLKIETIYEDIKVIKLECGIYEDKDKKFSSENR